MIGWRVTLLGVALLTAGCARPKAPAAAPEDLSALTERARALVDDADDRFPLTDDVHHGVLDNGLRWYVRDHPEPPDRAELRLIVEAGSILEDDDQRGLAHVVEHMAFNGTEAYPGTEVVRWLESHGVPFGIHINATTGYDETIYTLSVPVDQPEILTDAIGILGQFAGRVTFDPDEVERERGVVLEEWRTGEGASGRAARSLRNALLDGSVYVDRPPIGGEDAVKSYTRDALVRFYRDWYRPDLMSVVVVGDVDVEVARAAISEHFAELAGPDDPRPRVRPELPTRRDVNVVIEAEPEAPGTTISLMVRVDDAESDSVLAYQRGLARQVGMLAARDRLRALVRGAEAPILRTDLGGGRLTPTESVHVATAFAAEGRTIEALDELAREVTRLRKHGLLPTEIARARMEVASGLRRLDGLVSSVTSSALADELVRHVLNDEPVPGYDVEAEVAGFLLGRVTDDDVNDWLMEEWFPEENRVAHIIVAGTDAPTEEQVLAVLAQAAEFDAPPPADFDVDVPLIAEPPPPGTVVSEERVAGTDATRFVFDNGARLVVLPTDVEPGRVVFYGRSPGGALLHAKSSALGAIAVHVLRLSGAGPHRPVILAKLMSGRDMEVAPVLDAWSEGVAGGGASDELDMGLGLMWLYLTQPRVDPESLDRVKRLIVEAAIRNDAVPEQAVDAQFRSRLWSDHPAFGWPDPDELAAVTSDDIIELARARYGDVHDWVFVIAGDVDPEEVRREALVWIGSLPGEPGPDEVASDSAQRIRGRHVDVVRRGSTDRATVRISLYRPLDERPSPTQEAPLDALTQVLDVRLRDALREDLGGTYGVQIGSSATADPSPAWTLSMRFSCDPDRVDELTEALWAEVRTLRDEGPTQAEVDAAKAKMLRMWQGAQRTLDLWAGAMLAGELSDESTADILDVPGQLEGITVDSVRAAAARLLVEDDVVQLTHLPE